MTPVLTIEAWPRAIRIVSARFSPAGIFDDIARPQDLDATHLIESMTDPGLRQSLGDISLVAPAERISGPGTTPVMAAFTHPGAGSRFSDGRYGVYYAARRLETAIAETTYHTARAARLSHDPPCVFDKQAWRGRLHRRAYHDLRPVASAAAHLLDPDPANYSAPQALGRELRAQKSWGIVYPSVRLAGGESVAVFRPRALSPVTSAARLRYVWNGATVSEVEQIRVWQRGGSA